MSKLDQLFVLINTMMPIIDSLGSALGYKTYQQKQNELKSIKQKLQQGIISDQKAYEEVQGMINSLNNFRYMIDPRLISKVDTTLRQLNDRASAKSAEISMKANQLEQAVSDAASQQYGIAGLVQQITEDPVPLLNKAAGFVSNLEQPSSKQN